MGALMIIFTFVSHGSIHSLWGIFGAGVIFAAVGLLGVLAGFTLRPGWAALYFWALTLGWIAAIGLLIVNAALLHHYMNNRCGGLPKASAGCQDIREYRITNSNLNEIERETLRRYYYYLSLTKKKTSLCSLHSEFPPHCGYLP